MNLIAHVGQGAVAANYVPDEDAVLRYTEDGVTIQLASIVRLPTASGIERGAIERDPAVNLVDRHYGGPKIPQIRAAKVEQFRQVGPPIGACQPRYCGIR